VFKMGVCKAHKITNAAYLRNVLPITKLILAAILALNRQVAVPNTVPNRYPLDAVNIGTAGIARISAWKMRVITIYKDKREMIVTYVSTGGLQRQSIMRIKVR
jgi:hypothetical protein